MAGNSLNPLIVIMSLLITGLILLCFFSNSIQRSEMSLLVYSPPVFRNIVVKFSDDFKLRYGVRVEIVIAATGILLNKIELTKEGDVLITADHVFMERAIEKMLVDPNTVRRLSYVVPVIAVSSKNPVNVTSLEDLLLGDYEIGIADPETAPFGRLAVEILVRNNLYDKLKERLVIFSDVGAVATNLVLGNVKVAILPHIVKYWYPEEISIVWFKPMEINGSITCQVAAVVTYSKNKQLASLYINKLLNFISMLDITRYGYARSLGELALISPYDYSSLEVPRLCKL